MMRKPRYRHNADTGGPSPRKAILPTERQIQETCSQFLELDGWRRLRTEAISEHSFIARMAAKLERHPILAKFCALIVAVAKSCARAAGVGELGMADDLYIRYDIHGFRKNAEFSATHTSRRVSELIWIEWKRERGGQGKRALFTKAEKARIHQKAWHAAERARGALTLIAGEDFPASIDGFMNWYRNSGLMRRKLLTAALQREAAAN